MRGSLSDLTLGADLVGRPGRVESDLRIDATAPGYRVAGRIDLTAFDPRLGTDNTRAPTGELTARASFEVTGDSLADLRGTTRIEVDRSTLDGIRIFAGDARLRFDAGFARLDTLHLETSALELNASGALGLHAAGHDTVRVRASVDSLGGLRRWLAQESVDSLAGQAVFDGLFFGWVRDFGLRASLDGAGLLARGVSARAFRVDGLFSDLPSAPRGAMRVVIDSTHAGGLGIARAVADIRLDGGGTTELALETAGLRGTFSRAGAAVAAGASRLLRERAGRLLRRFLRAARKARLRDPALRPRAEGRAYGPLPLGASVADG